MSSSSDSEEEDFLPDGEAKEIDLNNDNEIDNEIEMENEMEEESDETRARKRSADEKSKDGTPNKHPKMD